jgi:hypothetical protein
MSYVFEKMLIYQFIYLRGVYGGISSIKDEHRTM